MQKAAIDEERAGIRTLRELAAEAAPFVMVEEGLLWPTIESVVKNNNIDLIVSGTRGRTGVGSFSSDRSPRKLWQRVVPRPHRWPAFAFGTEGWRVHRNFVRHGFQFRLWRRGCIRDIVGSRIRSATDAVARGR